MKAGEGRTRTETARSSPAHHRGFCLFCGGELGGGVGGGEGWESSCGLAPVAGRTLPEASRQTSL